MSLSVTTAPEEVTGLSPVPNLDIKAPGIAQTVTQATPPSNDGYLRFNPVIVMLIGYLDQVSPGGLDTAILSASSKNPAFMSKLSIKDAPSFLHFANDLLNWVPRESFEGKDIYDILCMFYFVLDQPTLRKLQTSMIYAQLVGQFLDTPASITPSSLKSFKNSPPYRFHEADIPKGGFHTFNAFFTRRLKPGLRPISSPGDDSVIVYPADCTYDNSLTNQSFARINDGSVEIKKVRWPISMLLQDSEHAADFDGGIWMHAFLNTTNYHRQHAPVSGTVLEAKNIQGMAHLEADSVGGHVRMMGGADSSENPGYQFLQTRGSLLAATQAHKAMRRMLAWKGIALHALAIRATPKKGFEY
ncbi:phosphatidylserine decarboxylase-domain-containing protein [Colletotrichum phormii]|uniref:Phosphatidylserine decarboxylase-domain-containing protein n=1 Tax=Colletotrichum phormii TaxID=359342 RepID=A0AAJ0EJ08_9PEZI|nr:phosphatidylserine decarboxylase-domain-containing protein [Colletotrichum phormii]KAK1638561.1 phosphatidylserine decarboxylase-domain-containing protein [Colletotrichum phormii]